MVYRASTQAGLCTKNLSVIKRHFKKEKNEHILNSLESIEDLDWHLTVAKRQRNSYNQMKANVPEGYLFIELDYKQKLTIGLSPRQLSEEYYEQRQRTVLGFGIYYRVGDEVKCLNIDIISDVLEQSAYAAVSCFRYFKYDISLILSFRKINSISHDSHF